MVLAVSLVFYKHYTKFSNSNTLTVELTKLVYLKMNSQIGAPSLAGLGWVFRVLSVLTHDWVCNTKKMFELIPIINDANTSSTKLLV